MLAAYLRSTIVTHHLELNLLNTEALDNGQIDYIKQRYMRPLVSSPLASGRIATGIDDVAVRVRRKLEEIAPKYKVDIESVAVAWLIKLGALPLIGTKRRTKDPQHRQRIQHPAGQSGLVRTVYCITRRDSGAGLLEYRTPNIEY